MTLREKYRDAITTAENLRMEGTIQEKDGRLYFDGTVTSEAQEQAIWDALKTVPTWREEIAASLRVVPKPGVEAPVSSMKTYTVQPGDTLRTIAHKFLGDAERYMAIFDANRDRLTGPDDIRAGQVLQIPAMESQLI